MKYISPTSRLFWEVKHRQQKPLSNQKYYMSVDIEARQNEIEERIESYKRNNRKLTKQMKSYLRSKEITSK